VVPVTGGNPPTTVGSTPELTFQIAPRFGLHLDSECNPRVAQTPHKSGMMVCLGDGSARALRPGLTPAVYWAMVTPAGGEVIGE
jgi:hypothetical protein